MVGTVVLLVLLIVRAAVAAGRAAGMGVVITARRVQVAKKTAAVAHPPVIQLLQMHLFKPLQLTAQVFLPLLLL
jgi:hypothetical protein